MQPLQPAQIEAIFHQLDSEHTGTITKNKLLTSAYFQSIFQNSPMAIAAFDCFPQDKMNLQDFTLLCQAARYNLYDFAISKFQAERYLNKYLLVSAPGEAAPSVKQSYIRLKAHVEGQEQLHSIGVEFGVDKVQQQAKIKQLSQAFGHTPHEVFLMLKIKTNQNGAQLAQKLHQTGNMLLQLVQGLMPELQQLAKGLKVYAKHFQNYVYLVIEVDNPLVDNIISFATQVLDTISPSCTFKFRGKVSSNLSNLLSQTFEYTKSAGQVLLEFDIDHVTMKKLKQIAGDNVSQYQNPTPLHQIYFLLFQELKMEAQFSNLAEALSSALQINTSELPKPSSQIAALKQMNIKENLDQFNEGGPSLITMLNQNCEAEGQLSINLHDFFLKVNFNIHINNAFDILS